MEGPLLVWQNQHNIDGSYAFHKFSEIGKM